MSHAIIAAVLAALALPISAAPAWSLDTNYWSGEWRTPFNTINWRLVPAREGRAALAALQPDSGAGLSARCGSEPLYFRGTYQNNDGQTGQHAACTDGGSIQGRYRDADGDAGWYRSAIGGGDRCDWSGAFRPDGTTSNLSWQGQYIGRVRNDGGPNYCAGGRAFEVSTYANDVRVRPPLVGWWQLCRSRLRGSGEWLAGNGNVTEGTFTQSIQCPSRRGGPRDSDHSITHRILGGNVTVQQTADGSVRTLEARVQVTSSQRPDLCPVGTVGDLTLRDSPRRISNGETADSAETHWPGDPCPGQEQGWDNRDAPAAEPTQGGPPDGGHWAIVTIR